MSIRSKNRVSLSFSMASMSDLVFLLLIFFMITSTMIAPNALKLLLPQGNQQTSAKPFTTVSITRDFQYYVEKSPVDITQMESVLQQKLKYIEDPTISLHVDKSVPMEQVVKVMNIAQENKYKLILATSPE